MRSRPILGYSLLFFLSGATGLVYELLWIRLLYQSFGSTIQSVTTVVAAYMGGLGLGAWLLGRRADRHPRPAALYGRLEILIGLFGLLSPVILGLAQRAYVALAHGLPAGAGGSVALRFGLAGLVLLVPTTLMGGTLPVLTRAFSAADRDRLRPSLGRLYGLNTLGAVVGTALAGFFFIEFVGIRASLWGTAIVNLAIGAVAIRFAAPLETAVATPGTPRASGAPVPVALYRVALVLLAVTAFVSLLDEVAWTRVLIMVVGGSTYAFTLVLLCFLLGIGVGSAMVARRGGTPPETAAAAALAQGLTALGGALVLVSLGALPAYILYVFQLPGLEATGRLALMGGAVALVVLVPTVGMGMTFPLLTDLVARMDQARGGDVGRAYLLNTVGSIVGAVLTGFVLVSVLGTDTTLRLGVLVNVAAALALALLAARGVAEGTPEHARLRFGVLGGAVLASLGLAGAFIIPHRTARLLDLGSTIYGRGLTSPADRAAFLSHVGARPLAFTEGRNTTVSVWESPIGRTLKVTGKVDASDFGDMDTQIMLGLGTVAAHPHPRSALAIGFGSGVTTGVLATIPGMDRVRVVELEPAVLSMGQWFTAVNGDVLHRANVRAISDDARSALQLSADRYDVVVSEPSNPWVAGVATLYTPEFYRIVGRRLTADGVFGQWVQLYQLPLPVVAAIVRNVREVFPHVAIWAAGPSDLLVLGSMQPLAHDTAWVTSLVGNGGAVSRLAREFLLLSSPGDYFDREVMGEEGVQRLVAHADLTHTDNRPQLEFVAARRFLDNRTTEVVLDSLAAIERPAETADGLPALRLARTFSDRLGAPVALAFVRAARAAQPRQSRWQVAVAAIGVVSADTSVADSVLPALVRRGEDREAIFLAGLIATARDQRGPARSLLGRALRAGADTARINAALALLDTRDSAWDSALAHVRASLRATRNTFRAPFARDLLSVALAELTLHGPPQATDSVLAGVERVRPGWAKVYEFRGVAALRAGACEQAADHFLTLLEFGLEREDGPELVERCRLGGR